MKFSLILNSRQRVPYLQNLITSVIKTTAVLSEIEMLISLDNDDVDTLNFCKDLPDFIKIESINRIQNLNFRLTNLAKKSQGKYIWCLNDDVEIVTQNWDIVVYDILSSYKDNIVYGGVQCTSIDKINNGQYSSFPFISKKAVDILTYFMSDKFHGLGGDVHIWRIYNSINRDIQLPVLVRHLKHEKLEDIINCDTVSLEMRLCTNRFYIDPYTVDIDSEVKKLQNSIKKYE